MTRISIVYIALTFGVLAVLVSVGRRGYDANIRELLRANSPGGLSIYHAQWKWPGLEFALLDELARTLATATSSGNWRIRVAESNFIIRRVTKTLPRVRLGM